MRLRKINRKAAFEMSMSTMVVIIIAVVLLVLGLVFVRQIFGTATKSVSSMDEKVQNQLQTMFGDEQGNIVVYNKVTSIKAGTEGFTIPLAGKTQTGKTVSQDGLKFMIKATGGDCDLAEAESWIIYPTPGVPNSFDAFDADVGFVDVTLSIPKGTARCSSIMAIRLYDSKGGYTNAFSSRTFTVKVV